MTQQLYSRALLLSFRPWHKSPSTDFIYSLKLNETNHRTISLLWRLFEGTVEFLESFDMKSSWRNVKFTPRVRNSNLSVPKSFLFSRFLSHFISELLKVKGMTWWTRSDSKLVSLFAVILIQLPVWHSFSLSTLSKLGSDQSSHHSALNTIFQSVSWRWQRPQLVLCPKKSRQF